MTVILLVQLSGNPVNTLKSPRAGHACDKYDVVITLREIHRDVSAQAVSEIPECAANVHPSRLRMVRKSSLLAFDMGLYYENTDLRRMTSLIAPRFA